MALNPSQTDEENGTTTKVRYSAVSVVKQAFRIFTTTLLSLLLPLSFLFLARLATANYLLFVTDTYPTTTFLTSYFLFTKYPIIIHLIVFIISIAALSNAITGQTSFLPQPSEPLTRLRVCVAWLFLVVLQVCAGVASGCSIAAGIEGSGFGLENNFVCRLVFFFGLHETTLFWWRAVVKPVVDDTIFGCWGEGGRMEKVVVGLACGGLWWWRLREEVEALVVVPEVKAVMMTMGIGVVDFVGWLLYAVMLTIGMLRTVKGLALTAEILIRWRVERDGRLNDEKV